MVFREVGFFFLFFWGGGGGGGTRYLRNMLSGANLWDSMTGCIFIASTICVVEMDVTIETS